MLATLLRCVTANAQAGFFEIVNPVNDPTTAITRCTINWKNLFYSSLEAVDITISTTGLDDCINDDNAPNPTVIHAGFSAPNYTIQFTNTTLKIKRDDPFSAFAVPSSPYVPFVVLSFRALPSSQVTVTASGSIVTPTGDPLLIGSANINWTVSNGANFTGDLTKPDGLGCTDLGATGLYIPGVTVTKTADVTAGACFPGAAYESNLIPFGVYNFDNSPFNESYIISASKTGTNMCCGVTSNDQAWMQEAILSPEGKLLWKIMAADFNGSGKFSTYDIVLVRKCILGQPIDMPVGWQPWHFTPWHNNPWPGDDPMRPILAPEVETLNDIPSDIKVVPYSPFWGPATSFWGVKRGDVDGDCQTCESNFTSDPAEERAEVLVEKAFIADRQLEAGQVALIPVYTARDVRGVKLLGIEILFDNKMLDVLSVENGDLEEEEAMHHIVTDQNGMAVRYSWLSYEHADIQENTVLFYVKVRAKQALNSLKGLFWQELSNDVNALFMTEKKERMAFEVGLAPAQLDNFSVELVGANPVSSETQLDLVLPSAWAVNVSLIDSKGFVVRNFSQELPSGRSSILLTDLPQSPGVYTVLVQTSAGQRSLRFVKL
ncbi:MAG: hypothetical protein DYG98_13845 [Haliscomenobacteraceae bacterium CHB4]|nr:hypothetical protein [Saprospiraceae bacterium]MCE7924130.1 hypothetical protein [Haliscomenobacteraceae bacterium CHB4]